LEAAFADVRGDTWTNLPFWTRDYVGLGAYRVESWDPGASVDSVAFDGYVSGRPKIDRLRVIYMQDTNAVAANLLAGAAHLVADITIRSQTGVLLQREWQARKGGSVYFTPAQVRFAYFQLRPDAASPKDVTDIRVRKAFAHAIDKQALVDTLHEGQGVVADGLLRRGTPEYGLADRQITRYPYDPRRSQQLLDDEAGLTRGGDGFYNSAEGRRLTPEWRATLGGDSELQLGILVDGLKKIGVDARPSLLARPFTNEARHTFPTMMNWSTTDQPDGWLAGYRSSAIPAPENRWAGSNSGAWRSPEYDQLVSAFTTTLDRSQRSQLMVQMALALGEQLPILPLYYNLDVVAHTADVRGVKVIPDGSIGFNIHEWEMV
jgi:peptide/nickel transport system substrate-binding protein